MTGFEARQVATIMCDAHVGCWGCSRDLIEKLLALVPEHEAVILKAFKGYFGKDYEAPLTERERVRNLLLQGTVKG